MVLLKYLTSLLLLSQLLLLSGCTHMIFHPNQIQYYNLKELGIKHENVFFKTSNGLRLHGWWLEAAVAKKASVIYVHGNAQNISSHVRNVAWLTKYGFDVFLFDYRGYGYSQGKTELDGVISDVKNAIEYGINRSEKNKKPVFVIGQSLGASLAIYSVANSSYKSSIKALFSVSAFSDYREITQEVLDTWWLTWLLQWPLSFTVDNTYSPVDVVNKISPVPLVVMHSKQDEVIPFHHSAALFSKAEMPKQFRELTGRHNEVFLIEANRTLLLDELNKLIVYKNNN